MPDPYQRRRALITGLVDGHEDLYRNNPYFREAVTVLAEQFLPAMVNGIAAEAEEQDRRFNKRLEEVLFSPPPPIPLHLVNEYFNKD